MDEEFFPAVRGPGKKYFVLDRHHAALALSHEKAECVQVGLVRDLSALLLKRLLGLSGSLQLDALL